MVKNRSRVTIEKGRGGGVGGWRANIKKKNQCNHFCIEVNLATGNDSNPFSKTEGTLGHDVRNERRRLLLLGAHTKETDEGKGKDEKKKKAQK